LIISLKYTYIHPKRSGWDPERVEYFSLFFGFLVLLTWEQEGGYITLTQKLTLSTTTITVGGLCPSISNKDKDPENLVAKEGRKAASEVLGG